MLKAKSSSPLSKISLSSLKSPKVLLLIVFFIILGALPVALYEVGQQQILQHQAKTSLRFGYPNKNDTCNIVYLSINDDTNYCKPAGDGPFPQTSSYQTTVHLHLLTSGTHTIHAYWYSYFCPEGYPGGACLKNRIAIPQTFTLNSSNTDVEFSTGPPRTPNTSPNGLSSQQYPAICGAYQTDFYITDIDGNSSCHSGTLNVSNPDAGSPDFFGGCWTGINCQPVVNTPTPTSSPTPTIPPAPTCTPLPVCFYNTPPCEIAPRPGEVFCPRNTPTLTPTITPPIFTLTPTSSPSATPTSTITPTLTVTPTGTLTPTLSPTPTPTGTTPPPTNTPPPTIVVVKPTLPPTGPGSTIVAVGLVGVAISVLGLALLIGI